MTPEQIDLIKMVRSILRIKDRQPHCQCRSGSSDTCPICTDMQTGEKFELSKDELEVFPTCPRKFKTYKPKNL